jgi:biopolymer transport protein ExbD
VSLFSFNRRKKRSVKASLNITPLIDINANLLFFMIINASIQEDRLEAGKDVELPESNAKTAEAGDLISVVVSGEFVSVNEMEVMKLENGEVGTKDFNEKKNRVLPLYKNLNTRFQALIDAGVDPNAKGEDNKLPVILVQADRRLPYRTVQKVMRTCGQAGFTRFRFAATEVVPTDALRGKAPPTE